MIFINILICLAILCALFFIFLMVLFTTTFAPIRKRSDNYRRMPKNDQYNNIKNEMFGLIDMLEDEKCEKVSINSDDGLKLYGRFYDRGNTDVIEIYFHGYRSHAIRDYCGAGDNARKRGRSAIAVHQRSHGESEGNAITFGIKERHDVLCWIDYAIKRFGKDVKIILSGVSMGAATILMASELNLPENVKGITADCPYSSPKEIICKVAKDKGYSAAISYPFIRLSAKLFAGIDIEEASPIKAVANTDIPILIIHGNDDRYVPYYMGKAVYEACTSKNKKFLTVEGAGHAISFFKDRETYTKTVEEFIDSVI